MPQLCLSEKKLYTLELKDFIKEKMDQRSLPVTVDPGRKRLIENSEFGSCTRERQSFIVASS